MGKLYHITPTLHFPIGRPFEVKDPFNGNQRGTWYFRSIRDGELQGPFMDFDQAAFHLNNEPKGVA